jgi:hypothetical protein
MIIFNAVLRFTDAVYLLFTGIMQVILGGFLLPEILPAGEGKQYIYMTLTGGRGSIHSSFYLYHPNN